MRPRPLYDPHKNPKPEFERVLQIRTPWGRQISPRQFSNSPRNHPEGKELPPVQPHRNPNPRNPPKRYGALHGLAPHEQNELAAKVNETNIT